MWTHIFVFKIRNNYFRFKIEKWLIIDGIGIDVRDEIWGMINDYRSVLILL